MISIVGKALAQCETIDLEAGLKLYRGTFEAEPNEYPELRIITGVKHFAFREEDALPYMNPDETQNPSGKKPRVPGARSLMFSATLLSKTRVVVFKDPGRVYGSAGLGAIPMLRFEQTQLFPLARNVLKDKRIVGYVTTDDISTAYDVVLDLGQAYIADINVHFADHL